MNLPSSLALTKSKLFQGRTWIYVLAAVVVALGASLGYYLWRPVTVPTTPTPATSPAAQAPVKAETGPLVIYGPPAPEWVERVPMPPASGSAAEVIGPKPAGPPAAAAPTTMMATPEPVTGAAATGTGTPPAAVSVPKAAVGSAQATAVPGPATVIPPAQITDAVAPTAAATGAGVLFARERYTYGSSSRRDPFLSLLDGKFVGQSGTGSLVDVGDIHLVGIMWGSSDKFALVEDSRGHGYVLRVGDPVVNGYISGISKTELQVVQNAFGDTQTLSIHLKTNEDDKNATRN